MPVMVFSVGSASVTSITATASTMPTSMRVKPRTRLAPGCIMRLLERLLVGADVVAAALGLVGAVGDDLDAIAGLDHHVGRAPRVVLQLLDVVGHQLFQLVRRLAVLEGEG